MSHRRRLSRITSPRYSLRSNQSNSACSHSRRRRSKPPISARRNQRRAILNSFPSLRRKTIRVRIVMLRWLFKLSSFNVTRCSQKHVQQLRRQAAMRTRVGARSARKSASKRLESALRLLLSSAESIRRSYLMILLWRFLKVLPSPSSLSC